MVSPRFAKAKKRGRPIKPVIGRRRRMGASRGRRPRWARELTREEYRWVSEYLVDLNKVQAYLRCRPDTKYDNARIYVNNMYKKPRVRIAVEAAMEQELGIPRSRIIDELSSVAFSNIKDVATWDERGNLKLKSSRLLGHESTASIQEISRGPNGPKIKLHEKLPALDRLSRVLGIQKDHVELPPSLTINVIRFSDIPPEQMKDVTPKPLQVEHMEHANQNA